MKGRTIVSFALLGLIIASAAANAEFSGRSFLLGVAGGILLANFVTRMTRIFLMRRIVSRHSEARVRQ